MAVPREVLLVGSVPLAPASAVFEIAMRELGPLLRRVPDGEQVGWVLDARKTFQHHPALEVSRHIALDARGGNPVETYRLKPGLTAKDLTLGPYHYADVALDSYQQFQAVRDQGLIPAGVRFQVTLPGPGTTAHVIELPAEELLPISREALARELDRVVAGIPAEDLCVQIDIAREAELEEYLCNPTAFETPMDWFSWTQDQMAESVAWLANRVPAGVELGLHICSAWHHDQDAGQDNTVLVGTTNAILRRVTREVSYIHLPLIPDHYAAAMAPLRNLALPAGTTLFLGLVHLTFGLEGAKKLLAAAETVVKDFGIGGFCGLGHPPTNRTAGTYNPVRNQHGRISALEMGVGPALALHRAIAEAAA